MKGKPKPKPNATKNSPARAANFSAEVDRLAEVERLREEARTLREQHEESLRVAVQHEAWLERIRRWIGGSR